MAKIRALCRSREAIAGEVCGPGKDSATDAAHKISPGDEDMSRIPILNVLKPNRTGLRHLLCACFVLLTLSAIRLHAQNFQDLYDFNCNTGGCNPVDYGYLTQGKDGNLYGTAAGPSNGSIFMVTPTSPVTYTDLYFFDGITAGTPVAALTLASDGNFYGTTQAGGTSSLGTVFRFTPPSTLKVLYNFTSSYPASAPVQAKDGNLYGITSGGQPYRVTLPKGTVTILSSTAPNQVYAPLLLASDGNLYGTSRGGGTSGVGTVFRMSTGGVFKILHNFTGVGTDGAVPQGPVAQGQDGNLYGTTESGGTTSFGTVFEISLTGTYKTLVSLDSTTDGGSPAAGLLAASDGFFYGSTTVGGGDDFGTLFQAGKSGIYNKLFDFTGITGAVLGENPFTTVMAHTNGSFYGVTSYDGGVYAEGTIYSLTVPNPILILIVEGPIFLHPGVPVQIFGNNLGETFSVAFGGVQAQFQPGSNTYLTATVPTNAIDGFVTVTFPTGLQIQSAQQMHILPLITNLDPTSGTVGTQVGIVGGGFAGATKVTFGGVKATSFTVATPSLIQAIVPSGAKTGKVMVTTPNGTATSKQTFTVN